MILKSNLDPEGDGNGDPTKKAKAINNQIGSADDGDGYSNPTPHATKRYHPDM